MILTYLAAALSPIGEETRISNIVRAQSLYVDFCNRYLDHAFLTQWILNAACFEETPENRDIGMRRNFAAILACKELWLCGPRISPGMVAEAEFAEQHDIVIVDRIQEIGLGKISRVQ